ncbi:MAG TPA: hydrolase [Bryobacterales bacterium]|nr:hydrolase [Bryobacterales bacterium]
MVSGDCQCPKIQLDDWRDREVSLAGQCFLSAPTPLLFHVPRRLYQDLESLEARITSRRALTTGAPLVLHRDGWFRGEVLVSVDPQGATARTQTRSFQNLFYSRVVEQPGFEAALREMPRFYRDLRAAGVGRILSMYFWYLNCPHCLLEHGAEGIILLAKSNKLLAADPCPMMLAPGQRGRPALPCQV